MQPITIVGAGMAGLICAVMAAQRGHKVTVLENQVSLPNNHHAVLRFKTNAVANAVNIPFKQVNMLRDIFRSQGAVVDALAYSYKIGGQYRSDRSIGAAGSGVRYIAPPDFVQQLHDRAVALGVNFMFNYRFDLGGLIADGAKIITMPQNIIAEMVNDLLPVEQRNLQYVGKAGWSVTATLKDCSAYVTCYLPHHTPFYRMSITGDQFCAEAAGTNTPQYFGEKDFYELISGILPKFDCSDIEMHRSKYAKILPINERARKDFISFVTNKFNAYLLGRFSTWRAGMLLDDLPNDVELILGWIENGVYAQKFYS
jgi:NAD(P)-binding Rossmann-like domain